MTTQRIANRALRLGPGRSGVRRVAAAALALAALAGSASAALAWGAEGHEIIAAIARSRLTPAARARVDALLASDADPLTAHDMVAESVWADAFRGAGHKETAAWHYADVELDHPDLAAACPRRPAPGTPASQGPADACVADMIAAFSAELASPATPPDEKRLALKYLLHFVGDETQPLHAADNHDHGGNCVLLNLGGPRTVNLHSFWDTAVVTPLGSDPEAVARRLEAEITPAEAAAWSAGGPRDWLRDSNALGRSLVYTVNSPPGCGVGGAIDLPAGYREKAEAAAKIQLEKAGVRLAALLNRDLAD